MGLVRIISWIVKIALLLALAGQLKSCALVLLGLAADKTERGIISYSKFSKMLNE
jgi:hypothetical protein